MYIEYYRYIILRNVNEETEERETAEERDRSSIYPLLL